MSVLKVKNGNQWDIVPAIKGDQGDPAADESITDDMLVTDGIKTEIEWLWGNQLMDIREGEVLTAADAYAAPPMALTVEGKSTQDGTPTPDAPVEIRSVGDKNLLPDTVYQLAEDGNAIVAGANFRSMWCKVEPNTRYTISRSVAKGNRFGVYTTEAEPAAGVALTLIRSPLTDVSVLRFTLTTSSNARYVFIYLANDGTDVSGSDMQLERGSVATPYVPYGSIALMFAGRNLLDESLLLNASGWTVTNGVYSGTVASLYQKQPLNPITPVAGPLTFSYDFRYVSDSALSPGNGVRFNFLYTDGTSVSNQYTTRPTSFTRYTHHVPAGKVLRGIGMGYVLGGTVELRNMQLESGSTATDYQPYDGTSVLLNLTQALRSLPDGTKDELHLSYLRPSKREGWAWYGPTLVRVINKLGGGTPFSAHNVALLSDGTVSFIAVSNTLINHNKQHPISNIATLNGPSTSRIAVASHIYMRLPQSVVGTTAAEINAYLNEHCVLLYYAATPTTTTLDPIELPVLPAPECTVWSDPATNLKMTYIQDSNLIIENLEATIADIATS